MGDHSSLRLEGIYTFSKGTLLQFGNGSQDTVYFYDANNNQRLDESDKKVLENSPNEHVSNFTAGQVSKSDIRNYGTRVDAALAQARRERDALPKSITPQKVGSCYFYLEEDDKLMTVGIPFRFKPSLSVNTRRAPKDNIYPVTDLLKMDKKSPLVDPSRCFSSRAFIPLEKVDKRPLDPKEAEIATGNIMMYPVFTVLGLKNNEGLDASYTMTDGAEHVHIDLNP